MDFLKDFTILVYVSLAIVWGYIFIFSLKRILSKKYTNKLVLTLFMILLLDSFRTFFESTYFGISVSTILGFLPSDIFSFFAVPENKAIPKVINLISVLIILFIFVKKWLPEEEKEIQKKRKREEELLKLNEELKSKSESLEKIKKSFEKAQEIANLGNWEWDIKNNRLHWSDQIYRIFALKPQEFEATYEIFLSFVHKDDLDLVKSSVNKALNENIEYALTHRIVLKDGSEKIVLEKGEVLYEEISGKREPILMSGTIQDITKIEKMRQKLENLNKNLEKRVKEEVKKSREKEQLLIEQSRLAQMGEMIGNIAHQWRQPLNALGLILQKVQIRYKKNVLNEESLNDAVTKGMKLINKMSSTIDDFRNFFNPNREKIHFDISDTISKSIEIVEASFKAHNVKIIFEKIEINYFGYPTELSQVLLNILNNAKDAILENCIKDGKVTIEIKSNEKVKIYIKDNGGGVSKEVIDRVFEPYFTTKDESKGTGIGLYMSKIIIEEHMGGKINLFNGEDGAIFEIVFPKINNINTAVSF